MKLKINKFNLSIWLLWIAIFPFYMPNMDFYFMFRIFVGVGLLLYSALELKKMRFSWGILLYPSVIIISCILNTATIQYSQVVKGCIDAVLIVDVFTVIHLYIRKKNAEKLFDLCYRMSRLYVILNILWIVIFAIGGNIEKAIQNELFFSRGKFTTAYIFLFNLLLFCLAWRGNKFFPFRYKKNIFVLLTFSYIGLCAVIQSSTGVVALLLFLILIMCSAKLTKICNSPIFLVAIIVGSMLIMFFLENVLSLGFVQDLIVNVLHKDISLTGRMQLYSLLPSLLYKAGMFGGGFGSYVTVQLGYHGWYNAQNGLAEIILTYGFLGTISFLIMAFVSALGKNNFIKPLNAAIFVFCVIAIIEIPYGTNFILLLSLLMNSKLTEQQVESFMPKLCRLRWRVKK